VVISPKEWRRPRWLPSNSRRAKGITWFPPWFAWSSSRWAYMLDGQRYEFLGNALLAAVLASPNGPNDLRFLLPIGMQKHPSVNTRNIFQSNMCIVVHSSLSCPSSGIWCNPGITACSSLSCSPASIYRTLLLRSSSVPLSGKTVPTDAWAL
jgi:hypothetical protein